jgi:hypothetical protein
MQAWDTGTGYRHGPDSSAERFRPHALAAEAVSGGCDTVDRVTEQMPAGWYPAPDSPKLRRYWDGELWTDRAVSATTRPKPTEQVENAEIVNAQLVEGEVIESGFSTRVARATYYVATCRRAIIIKPSGLRKHVVHSFAYPEIEKIKGKDGKLKLRANGQSFDDLSVYEAPVDQFIDYVRSRINADSSSLGRLQHLPPNTAPAPAPAPVRAPESFGSGLDDGDDSLADELVKLADLHRSGLLTDEEFTAAKAKLLE